MNRNYPAKLLLFGEYAVLNGGEAFAIPFPKYQLYFTNQKPSGSAIKEHLLLFLEWLKSNNFSDKLELEQFENDMKRGLDIETNIPVGYGLGSSGAITAAVYDKYAKTKNDSDLKELKSFLGSMENYFHNTSSGLDPLVSYLNKPVHINSDGQITIVDFDLSQSKWEIELVDTGTPRSTSEMVTRFIELMELSAYAQKITDEYLPLVHDCIEQYLNNSELLGDTLYKLGMFQLVSFSFAIPQEMFTQWTIGFMSKNYMKLCGAGGGGFMISLREK